MKKFVELDLHPYWFHFIASWVRGRLYRDVTLGTNWGIPLYSSFFLSFFLSFFSFFFNYFIIFNIYSETQASLHWVTDTSSSLILVHHHVILPRFPDSLVKVVPNGVHISLSPTSRSSCTIRFFLTKVVELCTIGFGVLFVSPPPFYFSNFLSIVCCLLY